MALRTRVSAAARFFKWQIMLQSTAQRAREAAPGPGAAESRTIMRTCVGSSRLFTDASMIADCHHHHHHQRISSRPSLTKTSGPLNSHHKLSPSDQRSLAARACNFSAVSHVRRRPAVSTGGSCTTRALGLGQTLDRWLWNVKFSPFLTTHCHSAS